MRIWLRLMVLLAVMSPLMAGMPSFTISELWSLRLQSLSFFLVVLGLSAVGVMGLWNYLRREFTFLPRLSYLRSLSLVLLLGLLFMVVLTMISGARELMTPGAWKKQGATYALADTSTPAVREALERLRAALWAYAERHDGALPAHDEVAEIDAVVWLVPDGSGRRFVYRPGQRRVGPARPVVHEPVIGGRPVLVLSSDGAIDSLTVDQILARAQAHE